VKFITANNIPLLRNGVGITVLDDIIGRRLWLPLWLLACCAARSIPGTRYHKGRSRALALCVPPCERGLLRHCRPISSSLCPHLCLIPRIRLRGHLLPRLFLLLPLSNRSQFRPYLFPTFGFFLKAKLLLEMLVRGLSPCGRYIINTFAIKATETAAACIETRRWLWRVHELAFGIGAFIVEWGRPVRGETGNLGFLGDCGTTRISWELPEEQRQQGHTQHIQTTKKQKRVLVKECGGFKSVVLT